ncbi:MAG: precorrin-4 C(11)-methyltransferase [Pseudomonadota bacterium]
MSKEEKQPIIFVGAGPGDPDLITVAGRKVLGEADLVVYAGSLVSPEMLTWVRAGAETVDSSGLSLETIVEKMVSAFHQGRRVVRLHTGDPSLYGAVQEQFSALEKRGVPYRIIPGVTAAFAAAAALGLEYTAPEVCQTLILTRAAGRTPVPEKEDLAELAKHRASMAIYLSAGQAEKVALALAPAYGKEAVLAVVYRAGWPDQKILWTTVSRLAQDMAEAGLSRQAIILAGAPLEDLKAGRETPKSKLYDPAFSHGFRKGKDDE